MEEHQFHAICHKLDKIIRLLEKLQPATLIFDDGPQRIVSVPGRYPNPNWAPDVNSTTVKNEQ